MILAVPLRTMEVPDMKPWDKHYYLCDHFKDVFSELGITLFPVFPVFSAECAREIESVCDGLVVSGSNKNIYPEYYGEERMPEMAHTYTVDEYSYDRQLVEPFVRAGKPILGICGGIQVLNVYFGGTLNQRVPGHSGIASGHTLHVEKDSFLYNVYGTDTIDANSYHGQCPGKVAPGFRVTARAEDGTIEAIEKDNIIGVQWHPEVSHDMTFFRGFVDAFLRK